MIDTSIFILIFIIFIIILIVKLNRRNKKIKVLISTNRILRSDEVKLRNKIKIATNSFNSMGIKINKQKHEMLLLKKRSMSAKNLEKKKIRIIKDLELKIKKGKEK